MNETQVLMAISNFFDFLGIISWKGALFFDWEDLFFSCGTSFLSGRRCPISFDEKFSKKSWGGGGGAHPISPH